MRLQSLQVLARWVFSRFSSPSPCASCLISGAFSRRRRSLRRDRCGELDGDEDEEKEGVFGLRAMMVLLPLQVHLQKEVADAAQRLVGGEFG